MIESSLADQSGSLSPNWASTHTATGTERRASPAPAAEHQADQGSESGGTAVSPAIQTWPPTNDTDDGFRLRPGVELLWFRLQQPLRNDPWGELWSAWDQVADQQVWVRVLLCGPQDSDEETERVKKVFRAVQAVHHQHICPVHLLGRAPGWGYFLVLQALAGVSLSQHWRAVAGQRSGASPSEVARLLAPVASALDHAHQRGLLHRSLMPPNIIVGESGQDVQLLDFALAALAEDEDGNSRIPDPMRFYAAPELLEGQPASAKTDQFALAAVAYEMLVGRVGRDGDGGLGQAVLDGQLEGLELLPEPAQLALARALARQRAQRFETCGQFVRELSGKEARRRAAGYGVGPSGPATGQAASGPWGAGARGSATVSAPSAGGGTGSMPGVENGIPPGRAGRADASPSPQWTDRPSKSRQVEGTRANGESGQRLGSAGTDCQPAKPRSAPVARGKPLRQLRGHDSGVKAVAFSPDGLHVVSGGKDKAVRIWDVHSGRQVRHFDGHTDTVNTVAYTPDGRRVVSGSDDGTIRVWDLTADCEVICLPAHHHGVHCVVSCLGGQAILSGGDDPVVRLWELASGRERVRFGGLLRRHRTAVFGVAASADGRWALSGSSGGTVRLWELEQGRHLRCFPRCKGGVDCVAFAPDATVVAAGCYDGSVYLWESHTGQLRVRLRGHGRAVWSLAFSPGGVSLLTGSWDGTARLWDWRTGHQLDCFEGHSSGVSGVSFAPDGRLAVSGSFDGTLRLWQLF